MGLVGKHAWEKVTKCLEGGKRSINFRNRFACLLGVWCNDEETCGSRPMSSNPPLKVGGESHSLSVQPTSSSDCCGKI